MSEVKIDTMTINNEFKHEYPLPYGWKKDHRIKLNEDLAKKIRQKAQQYDDSKTLQEQDEALAKEFGVSKQTIRSVRANKTWKDEE